MQAERKAALEARKALLKKGQLLSNKDFEHEKPKEKSEEDVRREAAFLKNRFESRYLTCPFNVGSFDVFTYVGKSMSQVEREAYKVFEFMEYAFEMDLLSLVTDWIRDADGNYWFLGVKSYMLT